MILPTKEVLTLADAAKLLGVSVATLRVQVMRGRLATTVIGKRMHVVTLAEIAAYRQRVKDWENAGEGGRKRWRRAQRKLAK